MTSLSWNVQLRWSQEDSLLHLLLYSLLYVFRLTEGEKKRKLLKNMYWMKDLVRSCLLFLLSLTSRAMRCFVVNTTCLDYSLFDLRLECQANQWWITPSETNNMNKFMCREEEEMKLNNLSRGKSTGKSISIVM